MSRHHPLQSLDPKALPGNGLWEEAALSCCDVTQQRKGSVATSQNISSGLLAPFHSPHPCCCAAKAHWDGLNPIPKFLNPGAEELWVEGWADLRVSCGRRKS